MARGTTIRLLGTFDVVVEGRTIPTEAWRLRKSADLVKLLALAPQHRIIRDQLLETLWPDKDPDAAANNLYQAIHGARSVLGRTGDAARIDLHDGVVTLGPPERLSIDVEAFEDAIRRADGGDVAARAEAWRLYRGDLLPDDRYQDWAATPRESIAASHRRNLSELAKIREAEGDFEAAGEHLRALVTLDPTDEAAARRVMVLEARSGRRAAAQQQYESLREVLRRELAVEPDEETTRLARDIVEGKLDPLGEHPSSSNIPVAFTTFVGRQREVRDVQRLLLGARLLTLTGTGGTGKTRLATEAAHAARGSYTDGVWLVELASIRASEGAIRAVADTFGVREAPGVSIVDAAIQQIGQRRLLLVLDNCEHLIEACARLCERLLVACPNLRVLATSRQPLRIPAEVLYRVPSLPISDPSEPLPPAELARVDAVRLFVDRAAAVDPGFAVTDANAADIARLCFHLDGLPLAIELAASRVAALPVAILASRLAERFDLLVGGNRTALTRQQTLRATIDWSYDLLTTTEQAVLRAMSVFSGRTSVEAIEAVSGHVGLSSGALLATLGALVDQSLIALDASPGPPRFRMLETVREYAHERLVESGEQAAVADAQVAWAMAFVARTAASIAGDRWADGFRELGAEHDSIRASLDRALRSNPADALAMVEHLWRFWLWDGHLVEGRSWLERALEAAPGPTSVRGHAFVGLAAIIGRSGEPLEHAAAARKAVDVFRQLGDTAATCRALQILGCASWVADDLDEATAVFGSGLDLASRAGLQPDRGAALGALAIVRLYANEPDRARRLMDESIDAFGAPAHDAVLSLQVLDVGEFVVPEPATGGNRLAFQETFGSFRDVSPAVAAAYALGNRGALSRIEGEFNRAAADLEASLEAFQALGDERGQSQALGRLGNLAAAAGDAKRGRQMLLECLEIRRRLGDSRGVSLAESNLGSLEASDGRLDRAEDLLSRALADFRRRGDSWGIAAALANLGSLALSRGERTDARTFLEASLGASKSVRRRRWVAWRLLELAWVALLDGDGYALASRRAEAREILVGIGDRAGVAEADRLIDG